MLFNTYLIDGISEYRKWFQHLFSLLSWESWRKYRSHPITTRNWILTTTWMILDMEFSQGFQNKSVWWKVWVWQLELKILWVCTWSELLNCEVLHGCCLKSLVLWQFATWWQEINTALKNWRNISDILIKFLM